MKNDYLPIDRETEHIATQVVDCLFQVHSNLGPGLLESVYEKCTLIELQSRSMKAVHQVEVPIFYKGENIGASLRIDILVEDRIILELKAVDKIQPVFEAQLLTYLKLTHKRLGFLVNFNVPVIKQGIRRIIL